MGSGIKLNLCFQINSSRNWRFARYFACSSEVSVIKEFNFSNLIALISFPHKTVLMHWRLGNGLRLEKIYCTMAVTEPRATTRLQSVAFTKFFLFGENTNFYQQKDWIKKTATKRKDPNPIESIRSLIRSWNFHNFFETFSLDTGASFSIEVFLKAIH